MGYTLSDDEDLIQKTVAEFARDVVGLEAAHERDRYDTYPEDVLVSAAGLGLTAMGLSADEGGAGVTPTAYAAALQAIAKVDPSTAAILAAHNGMALRLLRHAPDSLKGELLPKLAAGEAASYLATEEAGGSDKTRLTTTATPDGDGYVLTGRKTWGLGAAGAKHFIVLAQAPEGPTLFYVPADAEGLALGANEPLMGLRAAGIRTVYFDQVTVPATALVGTLGEGMDAYHEALPWLQVGVAATIVGCIDGAFEAACRFAEDRVQFNEPIGKYQAVSDGITNIDLQLAAARALTLEAAGALESDLAAPSAARAKAFASEIAAPMTRQAIRVQGGTGFMREGGTERFARDARCLFFFGETPHMQRDLLKRHLLDIEYDPTP